MLYTLDALAFAAHIAFGADSCPEVKTIELPVNDEAVPAKVYRAPRKRGDRGTILWVHGLTVHGFRDPWSAKLCSGLAKTGFTVVAAHFEEIASLRIEPASIDRIAGCVEAILKCPDLRPPRGRVAILAISISGAMALVAAALPQMRGRISAICSIAGMYDLDATIKHLFSRQDDNQFPCRAILLNFLHHSLGRNPSLEAALKIALEDRGYKREAPLLPAFLATLAPADSEVFLRLQNDPEYRLHHFRLFQPRIRYLTELLREIDSIRIPVVLIHGAKDPVVPPSQSIDLYERLRRQGTPVRLDVSPLLNHHLPHLKLQHTLPVLRIVRTLAYFLREAAR